MNIDIIKIILQSHLIDVNIRSEFQEIFDKTNDIIEYIDEKKDDDDSNTKKNQKQKMRSKKDRKFEEYEEEEEEEEEFIEENEDENVNEKKILSIVITPNILLHFNYIWIKL